MKRELKIGIFLLVAWLLRKATPGLSAAPWTTR